MSEKKQAIYVGNGKVIPTQYGDLMKLSFTKEDVEKLQGNLSNGWVNVVVKERREPSEKGTTHYLEIDTWKPEEKKEGKEEAKKVEENQKATEEDLPF